MAFWRRQQQDQTYVYTQADFDAACLDRYRQTPLPVMPTEEQLTRLNERRQILYDCVSHLDAMESSAEIVQLLLKSGVRGRRGGACSCPLGSYLSREVGVSVLVDGFNANILGDSGCLVAFWSPLRDFISDFDNGLYPELELEARWSFDGDGPAMTTNAKPSLTVGLVG
jgi:hypothetical protein